MLQKVLVQVFHYVVVDFLHLQDHIVLHCNVLHHFDFHALHKLLKEVANTCKLDVVLLAKLCQHGQLICDIDEIVDV